MSISKVNLQQKFDSFSEHWNPKILSLIHISEPTRQAEISYAVFCLKKKRSEKAETGRFELTLYLLTMSRIERSTAESKGNVTVVITRNRW